MVTWFRGLVRPLGMMTVLLIADRRTSKPRVNELAHARCLPGAFRESLLVWAAS